jgi:hypothetical protein
VWGGGGGGVGILNLTLFGCGWPWLCWSSNLALGARFVAASFIRLGNRARALFWTDKWLAGGCSVAKTYLALAAFARKSGVTVAQALQRNSCIKNINEGVSKVALGQHLHLWDLNGTIQLDPIEEDMLIWIFSAHGCFPTSSAYNLFFAANIPFCVPRLFGNPRPRHAANYSCGLPYTGAASLPMIWSGGDGHAQPLVSCAFLNQKPALICSFTAPLRLRWGGRSEAGRRRICPSLVITSQALKFGGCRSGNVLPDPSAEISMSWSSLVTGEFGRSATQGCLKTPSMGRASVSPLPTKLEGGKRAFGS